MKNHYRVIYNKPQDHITYVRSYCVPTQNAARAQFESEEPEYTVLRVEFNSRCECSLEGSWDGYLYSAG